MDSIFGPVGVLGPCATIPMTEASSFINFPINVCVQPIIVPSGINVGTSGFGAVGNPSSNGSPNGGF